MKEFSFEIPKSQRHNSAPYMFEGNNFEVVAETESTARERLGRVPGFSGNERLVMVKELK